MGKDTRSSVKTKSEENNNLKGKQHGDEGKATVDSAISDTSARRKSAREMSLKKKIAVTPSKPRKSERLEKQSPSTPPCKMKSSTSEKQNIVSPLRRSERGKMPSSSTSSGSKKSDKSVGSSRIKRKKDRLEKSVEHLTLETGGASKPEKQHGVSEQAKSKRMDARAYRALFREKIKKADSSEYQEQLHMADRDNHGGSSSCREDLDGSNECTEKSKKLRNIRLRESSNRALEDSNDTRSEIAKEVVDIELVLDLSQSSQDSLKEDTPAKQLNGNSETVDAVTCANEKLKISEGTNSMLGDRREDDLVDLDGDCKLISLKRKRNSVDLDSDAYAMIGSEKACSSTPGSVPSLPSPCGQSDLVETCGICFKRRRVEDDSTEDFCSCVEIDKQSRETSIDMARGKPTGNVITELAGKCYWCKLQKALSVNPADIDPNACLICKLGGTLLCCEGNDCRRNFHISCLDPPLDTVPFGVWHCPMCIVKKIKSGVHEVSKDVESILDVREAEISDADGLRRQKQYFVKFKDLAHVHNQWLPATELPLEASSIVLRFNRKNQGSIWKQEWTIPERLLQKRLLMFPKLCEEHAREVSEVELSCQYEWLVKWRGCDYTLVTWELDKASFLRSLDGQRLIKDYESRCVKAKLASHVSEVDEILERKRMTQVKLSSFTAEGTRDFDNNYLIHVNKLREFWHKGKNAVVIDNQDRLGKVIAFILTLQPDVVRPFLIISTSSALGIWDSEFWRLAPSVSAVVYKGNKNMRKNIRDLEFYEGNYPMFQALICPLEVMVEDLYVLRCIKWEAIIIDECHRSIVSSYFGMIGTLNADMRLLLLAGQLKDIKNDYHDLLSLLDSNEPSHCEDSLKTSDPDNSGKLKERFSRHIAYVCNSKFVEYWVPAQISDVQLELYCGTLLSNSALLCSSFKNDLLDSIRRVVTTTRKCFNHPYIVEPALQHRMIKGLQEVEYLDVGVKASGKLQLLDAMLMEMKKRSSRVLIIFQGAGSGTIGDILDDFLRQRFGLDSYERVDGGGLFSKKKTALNKFNNRENGRFLFLLERRACHSSVELSSVDNIIIYDSHWNPLKDLKSLQKINFDPQLEQIKIFRLYSTCTMEEKVLMLSLQNKTLDIQNLNWSCANGLLMWGASHLFAILEKFHDEDKTADILSERSLLKEVVQDLIVLVSKNAGSTDKHDSRVILKVQQIEGVYSAHSQLLGELKMPSIEEIQPHIFWTMLLDGRHPKWKYSSDTSPRKRKRVQHFDEVPQKPEIEVEDSMRKRKKVSNRSAKVIQEGFINNKAKEGNPEALLSKLQNSITSTSCEIDSLNKNHASASSLVEKDILKILEYKTVESDGVKKLCYVQKGLHSLLKLDILKLCQTLKLPEAVEREVEKFLEYIMDNHLVISEPATTTLLQAFQLSLCWTAASLLGNKIDHKESYALAKKHLNFDCNKQEIYLLYSRLRCLKKIFSNLQSYKVPESLFASEPMNNLLFDNQFQEAVVKGIKKIQKTCLKKFEKLKQKQQEEKDELDRTCEEEKSQMCKQLRMESAVIRSCFHSNFLMRKYRIEKLENEYAKKLGEHKCQMEIRLQKLEEEHLDERNKMVEREAKWVETLTSWLHVELLNKQILNETRHCRNNLLMTKQTTKNGENPALNIFSSQGPSATVFESGNRINSSNDVEENVASEEPFSAEKEPDEAILKIPDGDISKEGTKTNNRYSARGVDIGSHEQILHFDKEVPQKLNETVSSIDGSDRVLTACLLPSAEGIGNGTCKDPMSEVPSRMDDPVNSNPCADVVYSNLKTSPYGSSVPIDEVQRSVPQTVNPVHVGDNFPTNQPSAKELILNRSILSTSEVEISSKTHISASCEALDGDSSNSQSDGKDLSETGNPCSVNHQDTTANTNLEVDYHELSVNLPPVQLSVTSTQRDTTLLCNQAAHDQMNIQSTSTGSMGEIMQATEVRNTFGNIEAPISILAHQSNQEAQLTEPQTQMVPLLTTDSSVCCFHTDLSSAGGTEHHMDREEHPSDQLPQTTLQLVENPLPINEVMQATEMQNTFGNIEAPITVLAEQSNQEAELTEPQTQMVPLLTTDSSVYCFQTDLSSAGRMEHHMDREEHPSDQLAQTTIQPVENLPEPINEVLSQPATCTAPHCSANVAFSDTRTCSLDTRTMSANLDINNGFMQATPTIVSQASSALYIDPLQKELERICTEIDQTIDTHAQKKLQLKSECEKEIEEVTAQIHRKYETKLQESETEFDLRKKDLDTNYNKVFMNKLLAEAFRWKYVDTKAHDTSSCSAPQALPPPLLQNIIWPTPAVRPSFAGPSTVSPHTSNPPSVDIQRNTATVANVPTSLPASSQSTGSTSMHVHHSSTHLSSNPMRPPGPHISSISSPSGNLQIGSAIRAPAPHLQPFRSSSSVVNPHCVPSQHGPSPSATSPSFPQLPPRLPISAVNQSIPSNRVHQPVSLEPRPPSHNLSFSALDLLMDMNKQTGVNIPVSLPPLAADLGSNQHQPVLPVGTGGMPVNAVHTTVDSDVVCLSDDD